LQSNTQLGFFFFRKEDAEAIIDKVCFTLAWCTCNGERIAGWPSPSERGAGCGDRRPAAQWQVMRGALATCGLKVNSLCRLYI
jgi:hypothetical protein